MILYENKGLSFVPMKWQGLITLPAIIILVALAVGILICIMLEWSFESTLTLYLLSAVGFGYLFAISAASPILVESRNDELRIIYHKFFTVYEVIIKNHDLVIESYRSRYGTYGRPLYLYISSVSDKNVHISFKNNILVIGKILEGIEREKRIPLQSRELGIVNKYRELKN